MSLIMEKGKHFWDYCYSLSIPKFLTTINIPSAKVRKITFQVFFALLMVQDPHLPRWLLHHLVLSLTKHFRYFVYPLIPLVIKYINQMKILIIQIIGFIIFEMFILIITKLSMHDFILKLDLITKYFFWKQ